MDQASVLHRLLTETDLDAEYNEADPRSIVVLYRKEVDEIKAQLTNLDKQDTALAQALEG